MRPLAVGLICAASLTGADICDTIRTMVRAESRKEAMPALSVAIVQHGKLACVESLGLADLGHRKPNTNKTQHRLASLSKPITAVLTMMLIAEGRLTLADPVRKFLPALPTQYNAVTVRHLLAHQSGIREYAGLDEVFSTRHYESLDQAANAIFVKSPLLFEPGAKTAYTTYGYTLLGAALERAAGQSFPQILAQRLPRFALDDSAARNPNRARPYRKTPAAGWELAPPFDASNKYPGGGILSSAANYAEFLIHLTRGRYITPAAITEMWTPQKLSDGTVVPFATLGWATGLRGTHRYFTHAGLQPGATAVMHWFPEQKAGSVILCNAEGPDLDILQQRILHLLVPAK